MANTLSDDQVRELKKIRNTLEYVEDYLIKMNQSNAALHLTKEVLYSPLTARVRLDRERLRIMLRDYEADDMGG